MTVTDRSVRNETVSGVVHGDGKGWKYEKTARVVCHEGAVFCPTVDSDGVERCAKRRNVKDVLKTDEFTTNGAYNSAHPGARNGHVVSEKDIAARSRIVSNEGCFVRKHV